MLVKLDKKLEKYRADLTPTIKSLVNLTRILKGILPEFVMLMATARGRFFCYLTTKEVSAVQWGMAKLVVGATKVANISFDDLQINRVHFRQPSTPDDIGGGLYEFEFVNNDLMWVELLTLYRIKQAERCGFVFYVPAEGLHEYRIRAGHGPYIACSVITVT